MTDNNSTNPIEEVRADLEEKIPDDLTITDVTYEGPELVVYTDTPREFAKRDGLIRRLASSIQNRINVRPSAGESCRG